MTKSDSARRFFFALLLLATVLVALVARPVASALFVAAVFAGVLWPAHERLARRLGGRRPLSAAVWVIATVVVLLAPAVVFAAFALDDVIEGERYIAGTLHSRGAVGLIRHLPPALERVARAALQYLPSDEAARQAGAQSAKIAAAIGAALSAAGRLLFQVVMMLIALFALLVEGDRLVAWVDRLSPLKEGQTLDLLREFKKTSYAVVFSTIITSAVQATAALVGYLVARVPHPFFFAGVTFLIAFIPTVGAGSAAFAVAVLLFVTNHRIAALFLAVWALVIVSLIDNLLKPLLMRSGMEMRGSIVFFALIGGLIAFGAVGLLLGPLIVTLFLALLRIYERDLRTGA
jgi:predicted PurR-regulated permease PerM